MQDDCAVSSVDRAEWLSFESRMLRRRLSRCLLRADLALEDGLREDARNALAEAREIDPALAELSVLEARLAKLDADPVIDVTPLSPPVPSAPPEATGRPHRRLVFAVVAAVLAISTAAALGGTPVWHSVGAWLFPPDTAAAVPVAVAEIPPSPPPAPAPQASATRSLQIVRDTIIARLRSPQVLHEFTAPAPFLSAEAPAPPTGRGTPPLQQPEQPTAAPEPRRFVPADSAGAETRAERADVVAALDVRTPPPEPRPLGGERDTHSALEASPALSPPPPASLPGAVAPADRIPPRLDGAIPRLRPDDSAGVRNVLARYEGAYSALDADAASRIWPTVNRGALARAFGGLSRQQVSLGDCDVTVSGVAARATCVGTASWTPKVGGGQRKEERRWSFELRKSGEDWVIERASAR